MKKKNGIKTPQTILCCIVAALLIPALLVSSKIIDNELVSYIKQTLDEISDQNVNTIQCKMEDDFLLLGEISDRVRMDPDRESIHRGMKTAAEFYDYKSMGVIYRDGSLYNSNDIEIPGLLEQDHILRALTGENVLISVASSTTDGQPLLIYTVPVYDDSEENVIGALYSTRSPNTFAKHLSVSAFGGKGYAYIVRQDGTTVTNSSHASSYTNMKNAFTAMEEVGNNADVAVQMKEDMAAERSGCLSYEYDHQTRYINYAPLGINDWYILSIVPANVTDGSRMTIMMITYTIFALVILFALLFVFITIKNEKAKQEELKRILYKDELTGGISFTKFCIDAADYLQNRIDKSEMAACIMTDLENFRLINNLYGKAEGDRTILNSYRAFQKALDWHDMITRQTADRFYAMIFFHKREELDLKLDNYIRELKNSDNATNSEYILKPSIGVYLLETPGEDMATITNNATIAHDTIGSHGNRIVFYNEAQRDRLKANKELEDKMELAHQNHEFIPYFQPKYNASTGEICGAEALIRWKNSDGSITMPGKFIPLAESNGFIRVLDKDVFNAVCAFQYDRMKNGEKCVPISVNVSRQLMYEQNFASEYIETIRKYHLSPELVELEITESALFDDYNEFRTIIETLRENGFKILMDDFGTGYSSLMMLGSVPIDNLKLDKSFVDSFEEEKGRQIIMCVIQLAKSLRLPLTAEGVETRDQYDFLKDMGCNIIQGYYFSKPVPEETFREMLAS